MPLDISAHLPKSTIAREVTVPLDAYEGEESVVFSYDPAMYNAEIEALMSEGFESRPAQVSREILLTFITQWDLTENGEPIPITREGLTKVRLFEIQVPIVNAMMDDMTEMGKTQPAASPRSSRSAKPRRVK